jgi:hypothetical protein
MESRRGLIWHLRFFVAVILLLLSANTASADIGPKPMMKFKFVYEISPVSILDGQQIECEDFACKNAHPLAVLGPQRFWCEANECASMAYDYRPYHKLVLQFNDRERESNIFAQNGFNGEYVVTVREQSLSIQQNFDPIGSMNPVQLFAFFPALILTLVIELMVATIYLTVRKIPKRIIIWVFVANMVSLPFVWFLFPLLQLDALATILLAEIFAVVFEAIWLSVTNRSILSFRQAAVLSILMNAASVVIGMCLIGSMLTIL